MAKPPRIALTLPADTIATLAKLATLQKRPRSAIAADLLVEMTPALDRIAKLLELALTNRDRLPGDTASKLESLEQLLAHTATFSLDRMQSLVAPKPTSGPGGHRTPGRRRRGH